MFGGHPVLESIPAHPKGVVYMFHGSGGGVGFVARLETVDVLNTLVARGYGFVATDSTNRTSKQWNVTDASLRTNSDLARLAVLRQHVVATTSVSTVTPTYGIGMSNGAAFAALWAAVSERSEMPVGAVGLYMSAPRSVVFRTGGLRVPTFMVIGQNDTRTSPTHERVDLQLIAASGTPTRLEDISTTTAHGVAILAHSRRKLRRGYVHCERLSRSVDHRRPGQPHRDASPDLQEWPGPVHEQGHSAELAVAGSTARRTGRNLGDHRRNEFDAVFKVQNVDFFDGHRGPGS